MQLAGTVGKNWWTSQMNFTHSSRNSWALIRRLGAAQQPPKSTHPSVSANVVAAHLSHVAKALHDKKLECQVRMQGRTLLQQLSDKSLPHPFIEEISAALQKTKPALTHISRSQRQITRLLLSSVWSIQWFRFQWLEWHLTLISRSRCNIYAYKCPQRIMCVADARSVGDS